VSELVFDLRRSIRVSGLRLYLGAKGAEKHALGQLANPLYFS
jgi:hypothetical protein